MMKLLATLMVALVALAGCSDPLAESIRAKTERAKAEVARNNALIEEMTRTNAAIKAENDRLRAELAATEKQVAAVKAETARVTAATALMKDDTAKSIRIAREIEATLERINRREPPPPVE